MRDPCVSVETNGNGQLAGELISSCHLLKNGSASAAREALGSRDWAQNSLLMAGFAEWSAMSSLAWISQLGSVVGRRIMTEIAKKSSAAAHTAARRSAQPRMPCEFVEIIPAAFDGGMGMLAQEDYLALPANLACERGWTTAVVSFPGGLGDVVFAGARVLSADVALFCVRGWIGYLSLLWRHRQSVIYSNYRTARSLVVAVFGRRRIFMAHLSNPPKSALQRAFLRGLLRRFHVVRVVNEYEYEEVRKLGIGDDQIALIPYVVDWQFFAKQPEAHALSDLRAKYGLLPGERVALCLSNVRAVKRVGTALRAVARLRRDGVPIKLIVAGEDRLHLEGLPSLSQQAQELGIVDGLILAGFVKPEALPTLFGVADVLIHSAEAEGQCLAVYEAAAAGLPLCLSRIGSFTCVFSRALFHDPDDCEELADNVARVLEGRGAPDSLEVHQRMVRERCDEQRVRQLLQSALAPTSKGGPPYRWGVSPKSTRQAAGG